MDRRQAIRNTVNNIIVTPHLDMPEQLRRVKREMPSSNALAFKNELRSIAPELKHYNDTASQIITSFLKSVKENASKPIIEIVQKLFELPEKDIHISGSTAHFTYHGKSLFIYKSGSAYEICSSPPGLMLTVTINSHHTISVYLTSLYFAHTFDPAHHLPWHNVRNVLQRADYVKVLDLARTRNIKRLPLSLLVLATGKRAGFYNNLVDYPPILYRALEYFKRNPLRITRLTTSSNLTKRVEAAMEKYLSPTDFRDFVAAIGYLPKLSGRRKAYRQRLRSPYSLPFKTN
jgi:hypothetical protein